MSKDTIKTEIFSIIILILVLSVLTILRIRKDYTLSPLAITNKNLILIRSSIDEFYEEYKRYPNEDEIKGLDDNGLFITLLKKNINDGFKVFKEIEFPKTSSYVKDVDGIHVEITENNSIKICKELEALGLKNEFFTSNGGWIYSPLNGEFRANLQNKEAKDKRESPSRPEWGRDIDWYYK